MVHFISTQINLMFMHENTCNIQKYIYTSIWRHLVHLYISGAVQNTVVPPIIIHPICQETDHIREVAFGELEK